MNKKIRSVLVMFLLFGTLLFIGGCAGEKTPYQVNDEENFDVSVKFDANGGTFTTNVAVIVDSFNISKMDKNASGEAEIALLSPDDAMRGSGNAFKPVMNDHFLLGWYAERTEDPDGEGYIYSKKWDFKTDRVKVDAAAEHSATEPVMTLYAVWAPLLEIEFYDVGTDNKIGTYAYDPNFVDVVVPTWNMDEGTVDMEKFPEKKDHTFSAVYYDKDGTKPVDTETVQHVAVIDEKTGTVTDHSMKLYVEWMEGEWYHIYNAKQFKDNASLSGNYVIHADLDFSDVIWPTAFMHGNFIGSIQGNGFTFKNITATQTNNSKNYAGLFGNVTEDAKFEDVAFDNVTFTIEAGTRVVGTNFGLFAGHISEDASIKDVKITNSTLQIDSGIFYTPDSDYIIGLVCAIDNPSSIDHSGITCEAVGDAPETVKITVVDNEVDIEIVVE